MKPNISALLSEESSFNTIYASGVAEYFSWVLGILLCLAILRGVLHYGEQALNHYIAFKLLGTPQ